MVLRLAMTRYKQTPPTNKPRPQTNPAHVINDSIIKYFIDLHVLCFISLSDFFRSSADVSMNPPDAALAVAADARLDVEPDMAPVTPNDEEDLAPDG